MKIQQVRHDKDIDPFMNLHKINAFYKMNDALLKQFSKEQHAINHEFYMYQMHEGSEVRVMESGKPVFHEGKDQPQFDERMKLFLSTKVEVKV